MEFGKVLNPLWPDFYVFGLIFIIENGQTLKKQSGDLVTLYGVKTILTASNGLLLPKEGHLKTVAKFIFNYDVTVELFFLNKWANSGLFIFALFEHKFDRTNCRLQRDSNLDHRTRRLEHLDHRHGSSFLKGAIGFPISYFINLFSS